MGNGGLTSSGNSVCSVDYMDPKHSGIISPRIITAANLFVISDEARRKFIEFLLKQEWVNDYLNGYGNENSFLDMCYRLPSGRLLEADKNRSCLYKSKSSFSLNCSPRSISTSRDEDSHSQTNFVGIHNLLINSSMARTQLHLPIIIIAGVLPIFLVSPDFRAWLEEKLETKVSTDASQPASPPPPVNGKLHQMLISIKSQLPHPDESIEKKQPSRRLKQPPAELTPRSLHATKIVEESEEDLRSTRRIVQTAAPPSCALVAEPMSPALTRANSKHVHTKSNTPKPDTSSHTNSNTNSNADSNADANTDGNTKNDPTSTTLSQSMTNSGTSSNIDKNVGSLEDAVRRAISGLSLPHVDKMLQGINWVRDFVSFVEDLPLCVTVASATEKDVNGQGFPLIYVNEAFEAMTQYPRSEILHRNCRFLQSPATEAHQVEAMQVALREKKAIKLALTNQRKDGSMFFNFLAMKPIFNRYGEYTHVMGVQYQLEGHEETFAEDFVAVNDLLRLLPSILY